MTRVPAGESGGIDRGDRNRSVLSIESFQGTFEEEIEISWLDPAEEFLKSGEVRDCLQAESIPDTSHLFEITDDGTVIFFPEFFEQKDRQKLVLSVISPRIFAGIQGEMG